MKEQEAFSNPVYAVIKIQVFASEDPISVAKALHDLPQIGLAFPVTGENHIIAFVQTETPEELGQFIINGLHTRRIKETETNIVIGNVSPVNWMASQFSPSPEE